MRTTFSLPGIQALAYLALNSLPDNLCMQSLAGLTIHLMCDLTNIPFSGEPVCECTQTNAHIGLSQAVELSFKTGLEIPEEFYLAFLVLDANGDFYLIGTKEEHPVIERVKSFGTPDADPNTYSYTISLTAPRALIPCKVG